MIPTLLRIQTMMRRSLSPLAELRQHACDRGLHHTCPGGRFCLQCGRRTRQRRETRSYQEVSHA